MKKLSVLALLLILAMVLAACAGGGGNTTGTEGAGGFGDETAMPGGGTGFEETVTTRGGPGGAVGTSVPETGGGLTVGTATSVGSAGGGTVRTPTTSAGTVRTATARPTTAAGGGAATARPTTRPSGAGIGTAVPTTQAGGAATARPTTQAGGMGTSVPATGAQIGDFARLSTLMGFDLNGQGGESLGTISDFVISVPETVVDYVVVDRTGGETVLVPWAALMFDTTTNAFSLTGDASRLENAPSFDVSTIDFMDEQWDQDVLDFWMGGGGAAGTPAAGTGVPSTGGGTTTPGAGFATSTPVTSSGMGTGVPSTGAGTSTPGAVATGTIPGTGAQTGPTDIPYSDLVNASVMAGGATGAATNVQGTPSVAGTSVPSTGGTSTPGSSGTSVPGTGGTSVPGTGANREMVGTVEDVVVNVRSGVVAFVLISADEILGGGGVPATGGTSVPNAGTSVPTTGTNGTRVPTTGAGVGSGTSVPSTGASGQAMGRVIPVPMEFIRVDEDNQIILLVSVDRLRQAPVLDLGMLEDPINMGWDAQFNTFWATGAGGGAVSTPTP